MDLFVTRHSFAVVLCSRAVFQMLFHTDRTFTVLVFQLLLTHSCRGRPQVIGSSQPIVAMLGDDTILPCHLEPAESAVAMTLEWARDDLDPRFVYLWRSGQELVIKKHKGFEGRTSVFVNELKIGNISLKLSKVKLTDQGRYKCFIPGLGRDFVQLVVGAASSAAVSLAGINKTTNGVMLQCESEGWYPEPELLWLDAEGNLLSAGPPETLQGPDDLYTVSSRVTVDKRDNTTFTCRVQQKDTNQTRETHIHVPDEFFQLQSAAPSITGWAVSLAVCIVFILILLLVVWMGWRQNKTKRHHSAGTDEEEKRKNQSKTNRPDDQITVETESLMTAGIQIEDSEGNVQKEKNFFQKMTLMQPFWKQQRREEQQRREQELQRREQELQKREEELQRREQELQRKEEELQKREQQRRNEEEQRRDEVGKEVQKLKEQVETLQNEVDTKQAELQKIKEEKLSSDNELQTPKDKLKKKDKGNFFQKLPSKKKKKEELKKELKEANEELDKTKSQLKIKDEEISKLNRELEKLREETKMEQAELELENQMKNLNIKPEDDGSQQDDSSSNTGPGIVIEADQRRKHIHLINKSHEDQQLEGWKLEMEVNGKTSIYTFENSIELKSGKPVNIFGAGSRLRSADLQWEDLTWNPEDTLKFTLVNNTGHTRHQLNYTKIKK